MEKPRFSDSYRTNTAERSGPFRLPKKGRRAAAVDTDGEISEKPEIRGVSGGPVPLREGTKGQSSGSKQDEKHQSAF